LMVALDINYLIGPNLMSLQYQLLAVITTADGKTATTVALTALSIFVYWYIWRQQCKDKAKADERARKEIRRKCTVQPRNDWTFEEIKHHDGRKGAGPLLIAVDGDVYNVWQGMQHFGPGAMNNCFLNGTDVYRMLAKDIIDPRADDGAPLTASESVRLEDWKDHLKQTYDHVGKLRPELRPKARRL